MSSFLLSYTSLHSFYYHMQVCCQTTVTKHELHFPVIAVIVKVPYTPIFLGLHAHKKGHAYQLDTHSLHFPSTFSSESPSEKLSENLQNIIIHNHNHQKHQHHQPREVNHAFYLSVHRFSADSFNDQEYQTATVKCWQRKQVHNTKVCR